MAPKQQSDEPPAAPLGLTGLMRQGWPLYRSRFSTNVALFVAAYAVLAVLSVTGGTSGSGIGRVLVGTVIPLTAHAVAGTLATAAAIVAMYDAQRDESIGAIGAVGALRSRWRELLAGGLLAAVLSLIAIFPPFSVLATLLGLSFFAVLHGPPMVVHAIVLEGRSLQQAGPRARFLLSRQWARLLLYMLTLALGIRLVEGLVTTLAVELLVNVIPDGALSATIIVVNLLVLGALIPFLVAVVLAAYLDLRAIRDPAPA